MTVEAVPNKKVLRAPAYTTYAETEVRIDPSELEEAGWTYTGKPGEEVVSDRNLRDLIVQNHDEEHQGPIRWCRHRLCEAVGRVE